MRAAENLVRTLAVKKTFLKPLLAAVMLCSLVFSAGAKPYGLDSRQRGGAFLDGKMPETAPGISGNWSAVVAFTNLVFTNAVGLTCVPDSNLLCVWEREGRVW